MAKWGEGDPRWIVENRPDATNVNNWHWTEKKAGTWSKDLLSSLLRTFTMEENIGGGKIMCELTQVNSCEGDAVVNNRKGKLIFFYEWQINATWKGQINDDGDSKPHMIEGKLDIPNLSEENEIEEVDVNFTLDKVTDNGEKLLQFLKSKGVARIRELLSSYLKQLKEEYSKGVILPVKNNGEGVKPSSTVVHTATFGNTSRKDTEFAKTATPTSKKLSGGNNSGIISMSRNFLCSSEELYNSLTNKDLVSVFSRSPAIVEIEKKSSRRFEMFGGMITGEFVELVAPVKIVQSWRLKHWPQNHYSKVMIEIEQTSEGARLTLIQMDIPKSDVEKMEHNWDNFYWEPIKNIFGYGGVIS